MAVNSREVDAFLHRYRDFSKRLDRQKIIHYKSKFDGLLSGYGSIKNIMAVYDRKEASHFNVFNILNIQISETKTHTPFLKHLLDPNGAHGQQDLFLKSFIEKFVPEEKKVHFLLDDLFAYDITEEKKIHNGRMDIYLTSILPKKRFGMVIENKLYAGDQPGQLQRYYDFLRFRKLKDDQMLIFYLTINGDAPTENSIDSEKLKSLTEKNIFHSISYKNDISEWMGEVVHKVQAVNVKSSIFQYMNIINSLNR